MEADPATVHVPNFTLTAAVRGVSLGVVVPLGVMCLVRVSSVWAVLTAVSESATSSEAA
jgi:hypothetical protein